MTTTGSNLSDPEGRLSQTNPPEAQQKLSVWAVVSLILGITSVVASPVVSIPAVFSGFISLWMIRKSAGRRKGLVITVAGLVCAVVGLIIFFTVASRATVAVKRSQASRDIAELNTAIRAYYSVYSRLPGSVAIDGNIVDNAKLIAVLSPQAGDPRGQADNPRGILFMERMNRKFADGQMVDPWGRSYHFVLDLNLKNQVTVGQQTIQTLMAVWSDGPNGVNESGLGDDIGSW